MSSSVWNSSSQAFIILAFTTAVLATLVISTGIGVWLHKTQRVISLDFNGNIYGISVGEFNTAMTAAGTIVGLCAGVCLKMLLNASTLRALRLRGMSMSTLDTRMAMMRFDVFVGRWSGRLHSAFLIALTGLMATAFTGLFAVSGEMRLYTVQQGWGLPSDPSFSLSAAAMNDTNCFSSTAVNDIDPNCKSLTYASDMLIAIQAQIPGYTDSVPQIALTDRLAITYNEAEMPSAVSILPLLSMADMRSGSVEGFFGYPGNTATWTSTGADVNASCSTMPSGLTVTYTDYNNVQSYMMRISGYSGVSASRFDQGNGLFWAFADSNSSMIIAATGYYAQILGIDASVATGVGGTAGYMVCTFSQSLVQTQVMVTGAGTLSTGNTYSIQSSAFEASLALAVVTLTKVMDKFDGAGLPVLSILHYVQSCTSCSGIAGVLAAAARVVAFNIMKDLSIPGNSMQMQIEYFIRTQAYGNRIMWVIIPALTAAIMIIFVLQARSGCWYDLDLKNSMVTFMLGNRAEFDDAESAENGNLSTATSSHHIQFVNKMGGESCSSRSYVIRIQGGA